MVFQSFALMPWATVRDNVAFGLELRGVPKPQRHARADELLDPGRPEGLREPACRASCRAACSSASASLGPWPSTPRSC